jgi:hypothetical protein
VSRPIPTAARCASVAEPPQRLRWGVLRPDRLLISQRSCERSQRARGLRLRLRRPARDIDPGAGRFATPPSHLESNGGRLKTARGRPATAPMDR